jgi:hypothetical protein
MPEVRERIRGPGFHEREGESSLPHVQQQEEQEKDVDHGIEQGGMRLVRIHIVLFFEGLFLRVNPEGPVRA